MPGESYVADVRKQVWIMVGFVAHESELGAKMESLKLLGVTVKRDIGRQGAILTSGGPMMGTYVAYVLGSSPERWRDRGFLATWALDPPSA